MSHPVIQLVHRIINKILMANTKILLPCPNTEGSSSPVEDVKMFADKIVVL